MNIPLNPKPHTNSEMDSKQILKPNKIRSLTSEQRDELIDQYVEIVVDNMSEESLVLYAQEQLKSYYTKCTNSDLKGDIEEYDEELYDELVENVTT